MVIIDGAKVKRLREDKGIMQKDLAQMLNILPSTLCRWEKALSIGLADEKVLTLCNALECKKSDLKKDKESDIKRNAEGYNDPTAYQAIVACDGKEGREIFRGEIYEYQSAKGEYRTALVVGSNDRANDRVVSVLLLSEDQRGKYSVPVVCGQMMYTHCDMVSYAFEDRLGNYVRTATEAEMEAVDNMMADALGLSIDSALNEEAKKWEDSFYAMRASRDEVISEYEKELSRMRSELNRKDRENCKYYEESSVDEHTIRLQVERDMYKMFYEDIIRGGGHAKL